MKVLMVGLDLNSRVEGISNSVRELSIGLLERGCEVHYVTRGSEDRPSEEELQGIHYHRVRTGKYRAYGEKMPQFILKASKVIDEVVKNHGIDVVDGHSVYPIVGTLIGFAGSHARRVFTQYSSLGSAPSSLEYSVLLKVGLNVSRSRSVIRLNATLLDRTIAISNKVGKALMETGFPSEKIEVIPIAIDTGTFSPAKDGQGVRDELGIGVDERVILFAGDVTPWKGIDQLLLTMPSILRREPNTKLLILTKGTYEREEERLRRIKEAIESLGLSETAIILGVRADMAEVYAVADCVALPITSSYAIMDTPRSILEAMSAGKPVAATNVGSISELFGAGECGVLLEPSLQGMADALAGLLLDPERAKRIGRNARKFVESHNARSIVAENTLRLYDKTLGE